MLLLVCPTPSAFCLFSHHPPSLHPLEMCFASPTVLRGVRAQGMESWHDRTMHKPRVPRVARPPVPNRPPPSFGLPCRFATP